MTRTRALFAASFLFGAVAACEQASDTKVTVETVTAPGEEAASPQEFDSIEAAVEDFSNREHPALEVADYETEYHAQDEEHDHGDEHIHDHEEEHSHDHANDHDDHRHGGEAHVHGTAEFVLATTDTGAEAEFNAPLFNLIGFEHEPKTPEQEAAFSALVDTLADASVLFVTSEDAGCSTIDSMFNVERNGDHSALSASYLMTCTNPSAIETIELTAFSTYANMESIDVVFVGGANQSAGTATPESPTFAIGG